MYDLFIMDMGGHDANVATLAERFPHAQIVRYYDNHLDTIRRCINRARTPSVWIISSCCDYNTFNFDYRSMPWESYQIHCWASGNQKFGDTFLINVTEFRKQQNIELLEWYKDINWHTDGVPRLPWDTVHYDSDNLIEVIKNTQVNTPYVMFVPSYHTPTLVYDPALWRQKMRNIISLSAGNSLVLVPKDAQSFISTQVYDYPYIDKQHRIKNPAQDIIFISYDEVDADVNWAKLSTKYPNAKRLHGVEGMENALRAAAELSNTNWYYAVFAKTVIADDFNFDFNPDLFQQPKHYIFYAHNASNGLEYGYAGVILYNVNLVKTVTEFGIDYTMSAPHAVIPKISAVAHLGATPYQAWRSAFRECAKLNQIYDETGCIETQHRLNIWTTQAEGPNAKWILKGANDGVTFYSDNKKSYEILKQAFKWTWLAKKFAELYPEVGQ
jgi:hypothetical protein